jgi:hypothetical protein
MANGATGAILLHDLRERIVAIELDGLVARVCASKEAATALEAVVVVDLRD